MTQSPGPAKDVMVDAIRSAVMQTADQISAGMGSSRRLTVADVLDESQLATFKTRYRKRLNGCGIRSEANLDAAMNAFDGTVELTDSIKDQWVKAIRSVGLTEMANILEAAPVPRLIDFDAAWLKEDGSTMLDPLRWAHDVEGAS